MDLFQALRDSYLTEGLTDDQVRAIEAISEGLICKDLQEVIREFDEPSDVFILVHGKARVTTNSGEPIARLKDGSIFGEIALFSDTQRTASVLSDGVSKFVRIDGKKLNALMDDKPEIGVKILRNVGRTLCAHLRSSNVQLESILRTL
ncbi:MAG TPA: cyclic nucleotide-binding domain-containing protein [Fimbriimonadaceae bacterium]|nr:cyclic nucleotide-binding domain-containing protein [Fimbriimonadaceae bacterium]